LVHRSIDLDRPLDVHRESWQVDVCADGELEFAVNHAFADGLGAAFLIEDLLAVLRGHEPAVRDPVSDLHLRELPGASRRTTGRVGAALARQATRRVERLRLTGPTRLQTCVIPGERIDRHRTESLTRNDLLVAALHRALGAVSTQQLPTSVSIPVDIRRHVGNPSGLGNAVLNATTLIDKPRTTLVHDATSVSTQIRTQRTPDWLAAQLAISLRALRTGAPQTRTRTSPLRWSETAVCSNLGSADHLGASRVSFAPPAHDLVAIGIATVQDMVTVTARARADTHTLDRLLDVLADQF
jgi:hypothetical protein